MALLDGEDGAMLVDGDGQEAARGGMTPTSVAEPEKGPREPSRSSW